MSDQTTSKPAEADDKKEPQWWDAFPAPKAKVPKLSADEVMKLFDDMDVKPEARSFLLVDVRRNDWEVSCLLVFRHCYIAC
jgi:arsenical-resistance protein 2